MSINPHGGDPGSVANSLGLKSTPQIKYDFSVNINPLGPPEKLRTLMGFSYEKIMRYPEAYADQAVLCLAKAHGVNKNNLIIGNGSTEIFNWIIQAFRPSIAGWIAPCYAGYEEVCRSRKLPFRTIGVSSCQTDFKVSKELFIDADVGMLFVTTPNNPTGSVIEPEILISEAKKNSDRIIIVDESFIDFLPDISSKTLIGRDIPANLVVVKSLTKFFAIPGLRLGMAYGQTETIRKIMVAQLPWSVNIFAQAAATILYDDTEYLDKSRNKVILLRESFSKNIVEFNGFSVYPSEANFILVKLPDDLSVLKLQKDFLQWGILIRACHNFEGLGEQYCRLAIRPKREIDYFISTLRAIVSGKKNYSVSCNIKTPHKTPAIMVVGTMSNSGKSVINAGLCRYFSRRGVCVAPFKAQNMALNSYVTSEGGEMGRAQVCQAKAAGITPHTDMNPILLKPTGESFSQVIVDGHPIGNFTARDYYARKKKMKDCAHKAYDRLAAKYELIVIEGAGSPAEINLMDEDFVNMDMADYASADTILVADIDRGGVFASITGTISLLPSHFRRLIKGIIINKFRGDKSLLESGIHRINEITGIPVLGILPHIFDLSIEDEDSLGLENRSTDRNFIIDIVVIHIPRISNFTDFLSLEKTGGVQVRYVNCPENLEKPDLVIIPGTKNVRSDMTFLRENGFIETLKELSSQNIPLFGICGGYQILGLTIKDPYGVEGPIGSEAGLCLLDVETVLEREKELAQVEGITNSVLPFTPKGTSFIGYEIHAGQTMMREKSVHPLTVTRRRAVNTNEHVGAISDNGLIFGCYIHGLFDNNTLKKNLLNWLCKRKGVAPLIWNADDNYFRDEYDVVADAIEKHIDLSYFLHNINRK